MEKIDFKHGKFVLVTNEVDYNEWSQEDYKDFCDVNEIKYDAEDFYGWVEDETMCNYEGDLEAIREYDDYKVPVLITGTLGLWCGHPEIEPVRMESVYEALVKCIGESGEYVTAEWDDGKIEVRVAHHDGTNFFTIRALSKKGQDRESGDYTEKDFKRLEYMYA